MITAAVRLVVTKVSGRWLTFAIALTGITGSIASDAITVVLPPLAAMAFVAFGRSPLVGIGLGFASVSAGSNASLIVNATDPLLADISTSAAQIVEEDYVVSPLANILFTVPSSVVIAAIITLVFERWVGPRMEGIELDEDGGAGGDDDGAKGNEATGDDADGEATTEFEDLESARLDSTEKKGVRNGALAAWPSCSSSVPSPRFPAPPFADRRARSSPARRS